VPRAPRVPGPKELHARRMSHMRNLYGINKGDGGDSGSAEGSPNGGMPAVLTPGMREGGWTPMGEQLQADLDNIPSAGPLTPRGVEQLCPPPAPSAASEHALGPGGDVRRSAARRLAQLSPRRLEQQVSAHQIGKAAGFPLTEAERFEFVAVSEPPSRATSKHPSRAASKHGGLGMSGGSTGQTLAPPASVGQWASEHSVESSSFYLTQSSPVKTPKSGRRGPAITIDTGTPRSLDISRELLGSAGLSSPGGRASPGGDALGALPKLADDWEDEVDDLLKWTEDLAGMGSPSMGNTANITF